MEVEGVPELPMTTHTEDGEEHSRLLLIFFGPGERSYCQRMISPATNNATVGVSFAIC